MLSVDTVTVGLIAIAAVLTFINVTRSKTPDMPHAKWSAQSLVSKTREQGESAIYKSRAAQAGLIAFTYPDVRTMYDAFRRGLSISRNDPCLGHRVNDGDYIWMTYQEVSDRLDQFGTGLLQLGIAPGQGTYVGIYSINRPEWSITEHTCYTQNMVTVPLYDTLGADAIEYIINQTEMPVVVAAEPQLQRLLTAAPKCPSLKLLIKMDSTLKQSEIDEAKRLNIRLCTLQQVCEIGQQAPAFAPHMKPTPDDIATICYTSGTTGNPKGAILTHGNLVANNAAVVGNWPKEILPTKNDVHLSYLTLAHMLERLIHTFVFSAGARIGFYRGDTQKLLDDVAFLKPTYFISVPRLWNRIYDRVNRTVDQSSWIKRTIFRYAYNKKKQDLRRGILNGNTFLDWLAFSSVRARLGGRVKAMVTGAAPASAEVMDFLRIVFGIQVFEGYGQTEACAAIAVTLPGDYNTLHVGPPLGCVELKLVDIPEMNYSASDIPNPRGEICVRGPSVFKGYFKDPEKTAEAVDQDGWLHTGDVGMMHPNGTLQIIDRKKQIFKLAQGEYVAPEKIENILVKHPLVHQVWIHGDSLRSSLVAVVTPDEEALMDWAKGPGRSVIGSTDVNVNSLCSSKAFNKFLLDDLRKTAKEGKLHGFEIPQAIYIDPEAFTVENNLLTPTFKLKRPQAKQHYAKVIEELYNSIQERA